MIVMVRLVEKIHPDKYAVMQWHTQAVDITTNIKVNIDLKITALRATNVVTGKCHVYDSAKGRYYMILGRDILTALGLNLELSDHVYEADDGPFKVSTTHMIDLGTYIFKI